MNDFILELEKDLHATFKSEELVKEEVLKLSLGELPRD
jgi:hypothetical protein